MCGSSWDVSSPAIALKPEVQLLWHPELHVTKTKQRAWSGSRAKISSPWGLLLKQDQDWGWSWFCNVQIVIQFGTIQIVYVTTPDLILIRDMGQILAKRGVSDYIGLRYKICTQCSFMQACHMMHCIPPPLSCLESHLIQTDPEELIG